MFAWIRAFQKRTNLSKINEHIIIHATEHPICLRHNDVINDYFTITRRFNSGICYKTVHFSFRGYSEYFASSQRYDRSVFREKLISRWRSRVTQLLLFDKKRKRERERKKIDKNIYRNLLAEHGKPFYISRVCFDRVRSISKCPWISHTRLTFRRSALLKSSWTRCQTISPIIYRVIQLDIYLSRGIWNVKIAPFSSLHFPFKRKILLQRWLIG